MSCRICYSPKECDEPSLNEALWCMERGEYLRAIELALPLAEQGVTVAQCIVGGLFQTGLGCVQNDEVAEKWLRAAGEKGCGLAWHNLSTLYVAGGDTLKPDREEAQKCRARASENGFDLAIEFPWMATQCYEDLLK